MDSLLDHAPCGFVSFTDDGTLRDVNTTLAELLGYKRVELEGWHIEKILFPGARIFYQTHVFPLLKLHGHIEEIYLALRSRDGSDVPMLMNGARRERDGAFVNDCVFMRMIQRHQYEEQLLQARRMAEEASAAKANFLSMMSHDLRTPLTAITGHAGLLADSVVGALDEEQHYSVDRIRQAAGELLRMISDILDFSQVESGRFEVKSLPVALPDAIRRAESLVRLRMEEAGLQFASAACDDHVLADPDRLQQILLNLLTNAVKFTPRGGSVAVACEPAGDRVHIHVRDSGIGIDPVHLQRVFEPFVQLEPAGVHRGVGLGLAISRDLARAMHGELTAKSAPGQGSVFTVDLPRA
jgi:PAS domain S-box-containing protein